MSWHIGINELVDTYKYLKYLLLMIAGLLKKS